MSDQQDSARGARDAAVQSAISTGVYLAIVLGVSIAITRRDTLTRAWMRARALVHPAGDPPHVSAALADLQRDLSDIEHGGGPRPEHHAGLYGGSR
jgi:hypothetical protein